jgi:predicted short-subunit dehydrogenase-like oxidoreductase (DUF2520 family)
MITVVLLGAGNVASHLYNALRNVEDVTVIQRYNRNINSLRSFQNETTITNNLNDLKEADIYIIAVTDDAIESVSKQLPFSNRFIVHTSGAIGLHTLCKKNRRGVFYPLQTFTKDLDIDFTEVPICIETERKGDLPVLKNLAEALNCKCYKVNSQQRSSLHLAAVFVNNFTNQLYRVGHEITESKSVDFNILKPLIKETANKIETLSPYMAQTGPAKRNDKRTIKKHLKMLEKDIHKDIYELMTTSIKLTHGTSTSSVTKKAN